jgi:hypothetical protein
MTTATVRRSVRGTNLAYASLAEWLELVYRICGRIRCSSAHDRRCSRLYRSLRTGDIRASRDLRTLEACERLFNQARGPGDIPPGRGLQREFSRPEIGALMCGAGVHWLCDCRRSPCVLVLRHLLNSSLPMSVPAPLRGAELCG